MHKRLLGFVVVVAVSLAGYSYIADGSAETNHTVPASGAASAATTTPAAIISGNQQPVSDPSSIAVVVNKQRPLQPKNYAPNDLVTPNVAKRSGMQVSNKMAPALQQLFSAAAANGTPLLLSSGYRSYDYQVGLYNGYVSVQGKATADSESARPGYSEHQTGLAADVSPADGACAITECFGTTPAGKWLAANSYRYGFIIRYGQGQTATTGYAYEPWHIRYVGTSVATAMHQQNIPTLEQYFKLPAAPNY